MQPLGFLAHSMKPEWIVASDVEHYLLSRAVLFFSTYS